MTREMICIGCPVGCALTVTERGGEPAVSGNECRTGELYAKDEITNPTRSIAASVKITGGDIPLVSIKTSKPIPKDKIFDFMGEIKKASVAAPVSAGGVIIPNVAGTGADAVATRDVKKI